MELLSTKNEAQHKRKDTYYEKRNKETYPTTLTIRLRWLRYQNRDLRQTNELTMYNCVTRMLKAAER